MSPKKRLPHFSYGKLYGYSVITHVYPGCKLDIKTGDILLSVNGKTIHEEISTEIQEGQLREFELVRAGTIGIIRFQIKGNPAPLASIPVHRISDEQFVLHLIETAINFALQTDEIAHPGSSSCAEIAAPTTKARWWRVAFDRISSMIHSMVESSRTTKAVRA